MSSDESQAIDVESIKIEHSDEVLEIHNDAETTNGSRAMNETTNDKRANNMLLEFIELYRDEQLLWKIKHKDYMNKEKKAFSYQKLLDKYREAFPDAEMIDVKKKINNLRTNFRKELKKVEDSKRSAVASCDVYEPSLWYFRHLYFLTDRDLRTTAEVRRNYDRPDSEEEGGSTGASFNAFRVKNGCPKSPETSVSECGEPRGRPPRYTTLFRPDTDMPLQPSTSRTAWAPPYRKRKAKHADTERTNIEDKRHQPQKGGDYYDLIGTTWTYKLRSLPPRSRIVVEQAVNNVFHGAELEAFDKANADSN